MSARPFGRHRKRCLRRGRLRSFALAPVETLFEALPQLFAGPEDREVTRAPRGQPDQLDVVAPVTVTARVRLVLGEWACSPAAVADAEQRHLRRDSSRIA